MLKSVKRCFNLSIYIEKESFINFKLFHKNLLNRRMASTVNVFNEKADKYKGVTVDTSKLTLTGSDFEKTLKESLINWEESKVRGVWFKIPLTQAIYVPLLAAQGFEYHHAKTNYIMMTKWLSKEEENALPSFPHTHIGVAGLVMNDKKEVLVIKERYHVKKHWKFPGGYSNPGEDFSDTAIREVFEETGIKTEFQSVVAFRHYHKHQFDCSDIYVMCHLKPINFEIKKSFEEIEDCKWMNIEELRKNPEVVTMNRIFLESFLENFENKISIGLTSYFSEYTNQEQKVYLIKSTN